MERKDVKRKRYIGFIFLLILTAAAPTKRAIGLDTEILGGPLSLNGYINQGMQFGIAGNHYDTRAGFQQGLMQFLLESGYEPTDYLKAFVSVQIVKDWAYDLLEQRDEWRQKRFDRSKEELGFYDDYEDILKEAHVSWTPSNFNFRVGKQIVSWGSMDGVRIMDQINPRDTRRGFADVEFETSIIPIWLIKAQYFPENKFDFLDDLGLELIFDPNADFIGNKSLSTGNDQHGIWAADSVVSGARIGTIYNAIDTPDQWDSDGFQYGVRINGAFADYTLFTLNYFKGHDSNYLARAIPPYVQMEDPLDPDAWDSGELFQGNLIVHPVMEGYYPDKEYAGLTFSKELSDWYISALGGVAPMVRCEAIYEFDSTFLSSGKNVAIQEYEKRDALFWGIGIDWKFSADFINDRRTIGFVPQFSHRHIFDYPTQFRLVNPGGTIVREDVYSASLRLNTQYYNDKIEPMIYFQRDFNGQESDLWIFKLTFAPDYKWKYALQLFLVENEGYAAVDHKDNVSFTVSYQF